MKLVLSGVVALMLGRITSPFCSGTKIVQKKIAEDELFRKMSIINQSVSIAKYTIQTTSPRATSKKTTMFH